MTITLHDLQQFTGSETIYYNPLFKKYHYTEGVKYLSDNDAAWLVTDILCFQGHPDVRAYAKEETFQCWKLTVYEDSSATLVCEDGNGRVILAQDYKWTEFPLPEIKLFFCDNTLLLPSEY